MMELVKKPGVSNINDGNAPELTHEQILSTLSNYLIQTSLGDVDRVKLTTWANFENRLSGSALELASNIPFNDIKKDALEKLHKRTLEHPDRENLVEGTYVVFGDSHGKHTRKGMFKLLRNLAEAVGSKKNIHIGHILDDDNEISSNWKDFPNLLVVTKKEEIRTIEKVFDGLENAPFDIVSDAVGLGDLEVMNQDLKTDYVNTFLSSIDIDASFHTSAIVNRHLHELHSRTVHDGASFVASPGCLCEKHVVRVIRQRDILSGGQIKEIYADSHHIYRRRAERAKHWEQGVIIVNVASDGSYTMAPCRIKNISGKYVTSYFDKIITENGVVEPDEKIFVNADLHVSLQDNKVLDIQDQIVRDYKPDTFVSLGDTHNGSAVNHHELDRGHPISECLLEESSTTNYLLKKMVEWADRRIMLQGNHERFMRDFIEKNPMLRNIVNFKMMVGLTSDMYETYDIFDVCKIGPTTFTHGDLRLYGQRGMKLEKFARTFSRDTLIGHIHYPSIRYGCYSIGLTGKLDQGYNEPNASQWTHGLGMVNHYKGETFITSLAIVNYKINLNGKTYESSNDDFWKRPAFEVAPLTYEFEGE
jgi:hypothetical protein